MLVRSWSAVLVAAALVGGARAAPAPIRGAVRFARFFSAALGVEKRYVIYLPPSYSSAPQRRYPVAYYLHGLWGQESDWVSQGDIDAVADSLIAGGMHELILVMPDGDDAWYTNWEEPRSYAECAADSITRRSPPGYCVVHAHYADYVAGDLVRHIDSTYRTLADRQHRGIAGLSMGGYGAISLALTHPDVFAAAASHSGVLAPLYAGPHPFTAPARYQTSVDSLRAAFGGVWNLIAPAFGHTIESWSARDPAQLARHLAAGGAGPMPALFMDVGAQDNLVDEARAFRADLAALNVPVQYAEWPGKHDWRYWHEHVGESLRWLAERIAR
ncbi:MAG TPA: alpha/beta hydrolase family protein [Gemmatimonadales bacterium]|nr:alpha/beta hydrolase family protein [Gemmatimonadales bacterium]